MSNFGDSSKIMSVWFLPIQGSLLYFHLDLKKEKENDSVKYTGPWFDTAVLSWEHFNFLKSDICSKFKQQSIQ